MPDTSLPSCGVNSATARGGSLQAQDWETPKDWETDAQVIADAALDMLERDKNPEFYRHARKRLIMAHGCLTTILERHGDL